MKEIVIRIWQGKVWFNQEYNLPLTDTSFYLKHMKFRDIDIYWKVKMLWFNKDNGSLHVDVVDYSVSDLNTFLTQKPTKDINLLWFESLNWEMLSPFLVNPVLEDYRIYLKLDHFSFPILEEPPEYPNITYTEIEKMISTPNLIKYINESFRISFNDAHFKLGYVAFTKYIEKLKMEVDFKISNDNVLPEFDLIKFWFAKKLKAKDFKVSVEIKVRDGEVVSSTAEAPLIRKIDSNLIEAIRIQRTHALTKPPKTYKPDKWLFTSDEIFDELDTDDREGNVFNQTESEILKYLLEKTNIRNKKQLGYLAGKKHSENQKLLFTLNPNFGFIFFIEGKKSNHFIWELLNSHATYVWSINKDDMSKYLQFKRIEDCINTVRSFGRIEYKNAYRNNHIDQDLVFNVIYHDKAESDFIDGFVMWKSKLNELLV